MHCPFKSSIYVLISGRRRLLHRCFDNSARAAAGVNRTVFAAQPLFPSFVRSFALWLLAED